MDEIKVPSEFFLFRLAWALSNKRSFLSGLPLGRLHGSRFWVNCFAHVLSKSKTKYPHFKLYIDNIWLLTPGEHHIYDHSDQDHRIKYCKQVPTADWDKLDKKTEELKVLYQDTFPKMQGIRIMKYDADEVREKIEILNNAFVEEIKKSGKKVGF